MPSPVVVAGVGPALGTAVAREFAEHDYPVALLSRSGDTTEDLAASLRNDGHDAVAVRADVTDEASVRDALTAVEDAFGLPGVVVQNAAAGAGGSLADCDPETFESVWRTRAYGGFLLATHAADALRETAGTLLFSGTNFADGAAGRVAWSSAAGATRGLARSLAQDVAGVHVAYVAIEARIASGDTAGPGAIAARDVARTYRRLAEQDTGVSTDVNLTTVP
jgi:NAD(P)-dependent dehydrogenase (short-subunit alcohol dehydrogenase family)